MDFCDRKLCRLKEDANNIAKILNNERKRISVPYIANFTPFSSAAGHGNRGTNTITPRCFYG